jgi:hypothetical protein
MLPQEHAVQHSVGGGLRLEPGAVKALMAQASLRVQNLPCTITHTTSNGMLLLNLPGPAGVPGFKVGFLRGSATGVGV